MFTLVKKTTYVDVFLKKIEFFAIRGLIILKMCCIIRLLKFVRKDFLRNEGN